MSSYRYEDSRGGRHTLSRAAERSQDDYGPEDWQNIYDYPHTPDGERYQYEGPSRENFYRTRGRWAGA